MTQSEAAQLLDLPPNATPDQLEARFLELRAKLEDKIAKAPTPGLKEKYRANLAEITAAVEVLALAGDSAALPTRERSSPVPAPSGPAGKVESTTATTRTSAAPRKERSGREFLIVTIMAIVVLAAGGWWVVKTRAEKAEQARQVEEKERQDAAAKAELARQEAAAKAEADRLAAEQRRLDAEAKAKADAEYARLRATQAELKIRWEGVERNAGSAERRLTELRGDARSADKLPTHEQQELKSRLAAQADYVDWLQSHIERNPAKTQLARLEALLSARALGDAAASATELVTALDAAEREIETQRKARLSLGRVVRIESQPSGLEFTGQDAHGRPFRGTTPHSEEVPWGTLRVSLQPPGNEWVEVHRTVQVTREQEPVVNTIFAKVPVVLESSIPDLEFELTSATGIGYSGKVPAKLEDVPTGPVKILLKRKGWPHLIISKIIWPDSDKAINLEYKLNATQEAAVKLLKGSQWKTQEYASDSGDYTTFSTSQLQVNPDFTVAYTRYSKTRTDATGNYFWFKTLNQTGQIQFDESKPGVVQFSIAAGIEKFTSPDGEERVAGGLYDYELSRDGIFLKSGYTEYTRVTK